MLKNIIEEYESHENDQKDAKMAVEAKIAERQAQLQRLRKKLEKLSTKDVNWIEAVVKPMANELVKLFPGYDVDVKGPHGIYTTVTLYFTHPTQQEYHLTVAPEHGSDGKGGLAFALSVRDYKTNTGKFAKGTIGEINGGNYPLIDIPKDASPEWFLPYFF